MDFLTKILPWIGAAATGNVPGLVVMAAKALGDATGIDVAPTGKAIAAALAGATPEQIAAAKQADNDFALKMQAMGFAHLEEFEKIAAGDRASARERETKTGDSWTPRVLALFAVVCFVGLIAGVMRGVNVATGMREVFLILVGAAIAVFKDVYGYYFGSSAGSRDNQEAMRDIAKAP